MLDEAATRAVLQWRFEPYRVRGRVQAVQAVLRVSFELTSRGKEGA